MRVVSLLPAATEIIVALGATDTLVGVSHECVLPATAPPVARVTASAFGNPQTAAAINKRVSERSSAGESLFTMREAEIAELSPDLIITQALCDVCAVRESDVRAVASRMHRSPQVVTLSAQTLEMVFEDIVTVAAALGLRSKGVELMASLRERMKHVHNVLSLSQAPRPRVVVLEWTDPPFVAGHWVPDMIHRSGGVDVFAVPGQHSRQVLWDSLVDTAPAIVLVAPCGYDVARASLAGEALVRTDPWLARRTVWALDAARLVSQPGPGLVEGIETFAAIMHPTLFTAPIPANAIQLKDTA